LARKRRYFLVDVWRGKVDYPTLKIKIRELADVWKARRILVEDAGAGMMLVQELTGTVYGMSR